MTKITSIKTNDTPYEKIPATNNVRGEKFKSYADQVDARITQYQKLRDGDALEDAFKMLQEKKEKIYIILKHVLNLMSWQIVLEIVMCVQLKSFLVNVFLKHLRSGIERL